MTALAAVARREDVRAPETRFVWRVADGTAVLGAVVLDHMVAGRSCGGIRIAPVVTVDELAELAAVMTLKFGFFRIACGGAKAGLLVPADAPAAERERRTRAFGAALAPLLRAGTYVPGTDLGCTDRDLWEILSGGGVPVGRPPAAHGRDGNATAAWSGRSAAIAAVAALGGSAGGTTLAILGYGRVGAAFAARFAAAGGRVIAVATARGAVVDAAGLDLARLERARETHGDDAPLVYAGGQRVDPHEVVGLHADVLAPCATSGMLDAAAARRVRCRIVSPGANAAVTADGEAACEAAGITVLPDFVANAGGILVAHFWPLPLTPATVDVLLERRFRAVVDELLARAAAARTPPAALARALARANVVRLAVDPGRAMGHERLIARLARSRFRRALPPALVTRLVDRIARALRPW
jgi:glutamate dehydrogenase (NAD(P)+)